MIRSLRLCAAAAACITLAHAQELPPPSAIELLPETVHLPSSPLAGFDIANEKCSICHSADYIAYQPPGMTKAQWSGEVAKMQHAYGAPIEDAQIPVIATYLTATYGDAKSLTADDLAPKSTASGDGHAASEVRVAAAIDPQSLLASSGCLGCHQLNAKLVGPSYHDVAAKYRSDAAAGTLLSASIKHGSVGKWGSVQMPPFANLSDEQLASLTAFILKQ